MYNEVHYYQSPIGEKFTFPTLNQIMAVTNGICETINIIPDNNSCSLSEFEDVDCITIHTDNKGNVTEESLTEMHKYGITGNTLVTDVTFDDATCEFDYTVILG